MSTANFAMLASPSARFEFDRQLIERLDGSGPRYTSYPTADRFSSEFGELDYRHSLQQRQIGANAGPLSLYVHIPFLQYRLLLLRLQ